MATYTSTTLPDGPEIDRRLAYVSYLEQLNSEPVGIRWDKDSSSPILTRIDINGNTLPTSTSFFDKHVLWGGRRRCTINRSTKAITYGTNANARGDGLVLDGSTGEDVFVSNIALKYKYALFEGDPCWWVTPYTTEDVLFTTHPAVKQRGGTVRNVFYTAAYEMGLRDAAGTLTGKSVSGVQPWTGGEMHSLTFTSGGPTAFAINETLTGAISGATGRVVDYHLTSGSWAAGDAAGVVYLKQRNATAFQAGSLNGSVSGNDSGTSGGASTATSLTLDQAEACAKNLGTGFGICNPHTYAYLQLLYYIEHGTLDSQTASGKGIVDLTSGTGYAGKITGADSIDSRLGTNGTGTGSGTNGQTPICWRGMENLWGNCWEFIAGLNVFASDGSWRILKRDGTGTPAATLAAGSYETGTGAVPTSADGYINEIQSSEMGALAFIPSADSGSSSTYFCDSFYYPRYNPSIVLSGGCWISGLFAGVGNRSAFYAPSNSYRSIGARLEYSP
jgi:hypothetical protein